MKNIVFFLLVCIVFVSGCRVVQPPAAPVAKVDSIVYVEKLVPVSLPADSAYLRAWFECDSNNRVILKQLAESKTKNVASDLSFSPGTIASLQYRAKTVFDTIYVKSTERLTYKEVPVPYAVIKEVHELLWWQKLFIWCGVAFVILTILAIYRKIKQIIS